MVKKADNTAAHTQEADAPKTKGGAKRKITKKSQLIDLLSGAEAICLDRLSSALGWQRHTTSAAMTRLKQEGYNLVSEKANGKVRTYHIETGIAAQAEPISPACTAIGKPDAATKVTA